MRAVAFREGSRGLQRWVMACMLLAFASCTHEIRERCRHVTEHTQAPALPAGFAEIDRLFIRRTIAMTAASRDLQTSMVLSFRIRFAGESLPILCGRLDRARELVVARRLRDAGMKYQSLLLALQVYELTIAMHAFSEYAGPRVPIWLVTRMQEAFLAQMGPLLEAALSEDPVKMERALAEHGGQYGAWVESLGRWSSQVSGHEGKVKVAEAVWNVVMLAVAARQAAVAAADLWAAGRPPMPPLPAFAVGGGAGAMAVSPAAARELAEALRKLIVLGALDAGVMVGLSQLSTGRPGAIPPEFDLPTALQMSSTAGTEGKPLSINQMNQQIERGQAPQGITRIDRGKVPGEQDHAHLGEKHAINRNGTWKHGGTNLTREQADWLRGNGWSIPEDWIGGAK